MMLGRACIVAAILGSGCSATPPGSNPEPPRSATQQVVVFSDLHFDPFYDPTLADSLAGADVLRWPQVLERSSDKTYSPNGKDTNYALMQSALRAMHQAAPATRLVLIAGDFLAHGFPENFRRSARDTSAAALAAFTARTVQFLAQQIGRAFPDAQILPALGNNDSGCGNYMVEPGSAFLRSFAEAWQPLVNRRGDVPDFVQTFAVAGHYTAAAPLIHARVVVMNDVYWTPRYKNPCGSPSSDPAGDAVTWLNRALADSRSRGEPVWLLMHVPVGIDVFATLTSKDSALVMMLAPARAADLISSMRQFGGTVRYAIHGHTHMTEFRVVGAADGTPAVGSQGIPAVSPVYGNNPSFVVLTVDSASGRITDYAMHVLTNLSEAGPGVPGLWAEEYDLRTAYGLDGLSARSLFELEASIAGDSVVRANYLRFYDSGTGRSAPTAATWRAYWCGIANLESAAYVRCNRDN
jgi:sphingomyelin phosphodiesterase acid-like 3